MGRVLSMVEWRVEFDVREGHACRLCRKPILDGEPVSHGEMTDVFHAACVDVLDDLKAATDSEG